MTSEFDDIYSRFYLRVKDYDLSGMEERLATQVLSGYLRSALSQPMVRRIFSSVSIDEDMEEIEYALRETLDEDSDRDFVEEVLTTGMMIGWASPKYHSTLLTNQLLTNKEQSFYSQAAHLTELEKMYNDAKVSLRKLIRDRGYNLSVINGVEP